MHGALPSLHAPLRVAGRGRGWGVYQLAPLAASLLRHPHPDPSPPLRGGRGAQGGNIQADKFFNNRFSAVDANTCIFANRSLLPVSSVITSTSGPATAMQLCPAASP
jgi:hypothetical protein